MLEQGELPSGYKRCKRLVFSGTQYIHTDYHPNVGDSISLTFVRRNYISFEAVFSAGNADPQLVLLLSDFDDSGNVAYFKYFSSGYATDIKAKIINEKIIVSISTNGLLNYGGYRYSDEINKTKGKVNTNLYIGRRANNTSGFSGDLITFSINENASMNLIPALDKSGRPCAYDTVTRKAFYNAGSGEFGYELEDGTYVAPI